MDINIPAVFNEYGLNVNSPSVQAIMNYAAGAGNTAPNFYGNGNGYSQPYQQQPMNNSGYYYPQPQQQYNYNQQSYQQPMCNNQQMQGMGYYNNQSQMYGMATYQQPQYTQQGYYQPMYNNQMQYNQQYNIPQQGYYNPQQQAYQQPTYQQNFNPYVQQTDPYAELAAHYGYPNPNDREAICEQGRKAEAMLQAAMYPQQNNNGWNQHSTDPFPDYSNPKDIEETHFYETVAKMYNEGKVSKGTFAAVANAGIEHITDSGATVYAYKPFGFGSYGYYNPQQYYEQQQKEQELYNNNLAAFAIAAKVVNKFYGKSDEEIQQEQQIQYEQQVTLYNRQMNQLMYETDYNMFVAQIKSGITSDSKDYVSPLKAKICEHYDKVWNEREKVASHDMSFDEFMNGGGYAKIVFGDIKYENKKQMDKLVNLYDDVMSRNIIHQYSPFYDPVTGTSMKGVRINKNEIEISLPPELLKERYNERKEVFFNEIGHAKHSADLPTDAEFFAKLAMQQQQLSYQQPIPYMRS